MTAELGSPWVEIDAIHHLPNWEPVEPGTFYAVVDKITSTEAWVIDGTPEVDCHAAGNRPVGPPPGALHQR